MVNTVINITMRSSVQMIVLTAVVPPLLMHLLQYSYTHWEVITQQEA